MGDSMVDSDTLATREFRRILLVKPSSLGDLIHALPVLHGLRRRYPQAFISWLAFDAFAPLIEGHPDLNEVIRLDRRIFPRRRLGAARGLIEFAGALRARAFDLVIDLQGLFRSGLLAWATGAGVRIGFAAAREFSWVFYTHHIRTEDPDAHAADRNMLVGRMLGFGDTSMVCDLGIREEERRRAAQILCEGGLQPDEPFLAVLPGARWETKRWAGERFAGVIDAVRAQDRIRAVLLGAPDESGVCSTVASQSESNPINLAGQTGIRDLVAILERAAAVLAHDSAPMHVAAALNRPLVAILGPTNRRRTGPYGKDGAVVQAPLPCIPCYLKRPAQCPYNHDCMRSIGVDEVVARLRTLLK